MSVIIPMTDDNAEWVWPQIMGFFHAARERGGEKMATPVNIIQAYASGAVKVVAAFDPKPVAALAVHTSESDATVLNVTAFAALREAQWPELMGYLRKTAQSMGCDKISVEGRPGWRRVLARHGFVPVGNEMIARL